MIPRSIPTASCSTRATGAEAVGGAGRVRDDVVVAPGRTRRRSRPARASRRARSPARVMITFFAPASRCLAASSRLVKKPVDSITTSAPTSPHGSAAGSRSANTLQLVAVDDEAVVGVLDLARERAEDRVVLEQVGERLRVGDVVHADPVDVGAPGVRRAEHVAADAAEAVDAGLQGHVVSSFLRVRCGGPESIGPLGAARRLVHVAVDHVHQVVAPRRVYPRQVLGDHHRAVAAARAADARP